MPADRTRSDEPLPVTFLADDGSIVINFGIACGREATQAEIDQPGARVAHGEVEVTSKVTGYRQVRFGTGETLGWGEIDLPPQTMLTTAYWFRLTEATVEQFRQEGWWRFDPNDYGPTWARQRDRVRERDGYRCRNCGAP